ncbi:MAG: phosphatidate cytidylyltransferase [Streptococcaceae bacterium]|jgi:phosphatidate cytidylyltransferase|nr:phosphatidate cytidylyltransferase [Streptococcaceae bacterium]
MKQRIITGVVAGAIFIAFLVLGGYFFQVFVGILAFLALSELFKMKGLHILSLEGALATLAVLVIAMPFVTKLLKLGADGPFLLFGIFIFAMMAVMVFSKGKYSFDDLAYPFLSAFYVGFGFQALNLARVSGIVIVLFALFIVWSTDSGAYFIGRQFGRHKLIPSVSPNKTIEGSIGGIVSAVIVAVIMGIFLKAQLPSMPLWLLAALTVIFSAIGQLGDLVESSIKRHFEVKDSGKILPGHGGILDRFDSMIFVLPIMHLLGLF